MTMGNQHVAKMTKVSFSIELTDLAQRILSFFSYNLLCLGSTQAVAIKMKF